MINYFKIFFRYLALHLQSSMEYKRAFWLQVAGMMLNNGAFVVFWKVIFARFGASFAAAGVPFSEVMLIWALASSGFGFAFVFLAGARELSGYIYSGKLDVYLLYPKDPLFMIGISKSQASAWGDMAYGFILYFLFVPVTLPGLLTFALMVALSGLFLASAMALANCLSFVWGNAEDLAQTFLGGLVMFGIYPERIFSSEIKFLLFTAIPVGFMVYLPVRLVLRFDPLLMLTLLAADAAMLGLAWTAFRAGLRRYESGSLFVATR